MKRFMRSENGQSLVLVALILAILFGFLALAVDGSNNYLQRRRMQNAADGAAVAGTVALATGSISEQALCATVQDYAVTRQGADSDQLSIYYTPGDVPVQCLNQSTMSGANGIHVRVGHQFAAFVAGIIGRSSFNVMAEATAQFGTASSVVGASPVAIAEFAFTYGETYKIWGHDCARQEGQGSSGEGVCDTSQGNIAGANFGIVDPTCESPPNDCNTSDAQLKQWLREGYRTAAVQEGALLQGEPGGRYGWVNDNRCPPCGNDAMNILQEATVGQTLIFPVYDRVYHYTNNQVCNPDSVEYDPGPSAGQCHDNPYYGQDHGQDDYNPDYSIIIDAYTNDPSCNDSNNKCYYYHITAFAAYQVSTVHTAGSQKYIAGQFVRFVAPGGETGGSQDKGVTIIKLTQ